MNSYYKSQRARVLAILLLVTMLLITVFKPEHSYASTALKAPTNLSVTLKGTTLTVKWDSSPNAIGYQVYRQFDGSTTWQKVCKTTKTKITDSIPSTLCSVKYRVKAYTGNNGKTIWSSYSKSYKFAFKYDELDFSVLPEYTGDVYIEINNNTPYFNSKERKNLSVFETYSKLDSLGRCGIAYANVCKEIMPTEERGSIGSVKPSGWQTVKYNGVVEGNYLYNRCHLIAFCLTGENANKKNLITGTRYFNVNGMLPFEDMVLDYVRETNNHVLYRVQPYFRDTDLVAKGVLMEAYSVEDKGKGISYCVFVYNIQPGIIIDYATGSSKLEDSSDKESAISDSSNKNNSRKDTTSNDSSKENDNSDDSSKKNESATADDSSKKNGSAKIEDTPVADSTQITYILNTNSKKFHYAFCRSVSTIAEKNKSTSTLSRSELISKGYSACGICKP